jgi:hypothetical protein
MKAFMMEKLKSLNFPKLTPGMLAYAVLIVLILAELIFSGLQAKASQQSLLQKLDSMNTQIVQLSTNSNNSENFNASLSTLRQQMQSVEKGVNENAKGSEIHQISSQLSSLSREIEALKKIISTNSSGKEYLDKSELPFSVNTIDVIAESPFVSVNYQHTMMPLEAGDSLAGWQLVSADYNSGTVEFKNDKNQFVDVAIQG